MATSPAQLPPDHPTTVPFPAQVDLPKGSLAKNYGSLIGFGGVMFALLEIFRDDPHGSVNLFAEFGPKYLLWAFIAYILWDVAKRLLRVVNKGADNIGVMARNTGDLAAGVNAFATKSDRTADEMRRLCSFSASQSERAVELSHESLEVAKENNTLLQQLVAQSSPATVPKESQP